jgi:hypothetical protein
MKEMPALSNKPMTLHQHSKLGVASFVMAVSIPLLLILFVVLALALGTTTKDSPGWYAVWAAMIFGLLAPLGHLIGIILGVVAVVRAQYKKLFAVLGIMLNAILGGTGVVILVFVIQQMFKSLGAFR